MVWLRMSIKRIKTCSVSGNEMLIEPETDEPGLSVGLYVPGDFYSATRKALECQALYRRKIGILSFYQAWGQGRESPDLAGIEWVLKNGFVPMITWEPWRLGGLTENEGRSLAEQADFSLSAIADGRHEEYIRKWAVDLKKISAPIFFRPMHEMNGNWYPWCGTTNGNRPAEYAETWRYLRDLFRKAGNDKLIWVWCPYALSVPDDPDNDLMNYFPGEDDVDWLALDGYNWGTTREWSGWQGFLGVFGEAYDRLSRLSPDKPFMIGEVGCAESGGCKSSWIADAPEVLRNHFTRVRTVIWFDIDKECDWRIESSPQSLDSFRAHWTGSQ